MKTKTQKINAKILTCFLVALILVIQICIPIEAKEAVSSETTRIEASQSSPQQMSAEVNGNTLQFHLVDNRVEDSTIVGLMLLKRVNDSKMDVLAENKRFYGHQCDISMDVSDVEDGQYEISIAYSLVGDGEEEYMCDGAYYHIDTVITNGVPEFYSNNGGGEQAFLNSINSKYDSSNYLKSTYSGSDAAVYNEIENKAREITSGCNTDEEKVRAIHDWICENIAYDYESYYSDRWNALNHSATVKWAYENKRTICDGYSRLADVMLTSVGVPVMYVVGNVTSTPESHAWNLIYYNGTWHVFDFTWDSVNRYYGEGDSRNILNKKAMHTYYDINPFIFGYDHISDYIEEGTFNEDIYDNPSYIINVGTTYNLPKEGTFGDVKRDVVWSSDNTSVIRIEDNYLLEAVGIGRAVIKEKSTDGKYKRLFLIEVKERQPDYSISVGTTYNLPKEVNFKEGTKEVVWSSSDYSVVNINNNLLTAVGEGKAIVTGRSVDGTSRVEYLVEVKAEEKQPDNSTEDTSNGEESDSSTEDISNGEESDSSTDDIDNNNESDVVTVLDAVTGFNTTLSKEIVSEGKLYRMYNPYGGEHFYTKNSEEVKYLVSLGWHHESDADFTVVDASDKDAIAVYRLYNPHDGGMHFYTENAAEARYLSTIGWNYEGISHYVYNKNADKGVAQYRLFNPYSTNGEHIWTSESSERNYLVELGWINEGICWKIP